MRDLVQEAALSAAEQPRGAESGTEAEARAAEVGAPLPDSPPLRPASDGSVVTFVLALLCLLSSRRERSQICALRPPPTSVLLCEPSSSASDTMGEGLG